MKSKSYIISIVMLLFSSCQMKKVSHSSKDTKMQIADGKSLVLVSYNSYKSLRNSSTDSSLLIPKGGKFSFILLAESKNYANTKHFTYLVTDSTGRFLAKKYGEDKKATKGEENAMWTNSDSLELDSLTTSLVFLKTIHTRTKDTSIFKIPINL